MKYFVIKTLTGTRAVGAGHPPFIVAELSGNHGGRFETALALVEAAARAGADAVKLQTYTPDTMTIDSDAPPFRVGGGGNPSEWEGKTLYSLYKEAMTPWEWQAPLKEKAESLGLAFFSTPFDQSAVSFLEKLGVPCYKIAAYEANDVELLKTAAETGKPVIVSVGLLTLPEIEEAVAALRGAGAEGIALLHSITTYARIMPSASLNLGVIPDLAEKFGVVSGFSDNTGSIEAPVLAAASGAAIIEKHLILAHDSKILDDQFSLDPTEFKGMVERIRKGKARAPRLDAPRYGPQSEEEKHNLRYRRSLFVVRDIKKGERFTRQNVRSIRPGAGLPPRKLPRVLGKKSLHAIKRGEPLLAKDLPVRHFSFRKATMADAERLLSWRNDPETRANSLETRPITREEHLVWLSKSIADTARVLLIAESNGAAVGTVRIDKREGAHELSWTVAPEARGKGVGTALVSQALKLSLLTGKKIVVRIKQSNAASRRIAEKAGFKKTKDAELEEWEQAVP